MSTNSRPDNSARALPTEDFPAPIMPTRIQQRSIKKKAEGIVSLQPYLARPGFSNYGEVVAPPPALLSLSSSMIVGVTNMMSSVSSFVVVRVRKNCPMIGISLNTG